MTLPKLLLCTDMDRTVIPNGFEPEHPDARKQFKAFCSNPDVTLVYVTGRHIALVQQAIDDYDLPEPCYVISDVGTKIYQMIKDEWSEITEWQTEINKDWQGYKSLDIQQLFNSISALVLQEVSKQSTHKLSYYLPLNIDHEDVLQQMEQALTNIDIDVSIIWSLDEANDMGLIDVLPRHATKLHAIEFLKDKLKFSLEQVVFAGDSGNDLPVLGSQINSILVGNASNEIKAEAQQLALKNGHAAALYIANSAKLEMDGNYAAGVLQGIRHYAPHFEVG